MEYFVIGFFTWIASGIAAMIIATPKKGASAGMIMGLILGPLGVIAAFALDFRPLCAQCHEHVNDGAKICPHCHSKFQN